MRRWAYKSGLIALAVSLLGTAAILYGNQPISAETKSKEPVRFIACPIYRDTDQGPKSGCWLADNRRTGVRYDVGKGRSKPFLGREVLIEGFPSDEENVCGGRVMTPVRVSTLPTRCPEHMLPAGDYPGRVFSSPDDVMQPADVPRDVPPPPYEPKTFTIYFNHGSDFPVYQYSELLLEDAAIYAKASEAEKVEITGYAATEGDRVSGRLIKEDLAVAKSRANKAATALRRLQVPEKVITVDWQGKPKPTPSGDAGLVEASKRRVTIVITP